MTLSTNAGLAIVGAKVADADTDQLPSKRDVVMQGNRLTGAASGDERTLDATGCIVLPGFIDVHTHLEPEWGGTMGPDMLVAAGVTCAVDVTGPVASVRELLRKRGVRISVGVCDAVNMDRVGSGLAAARLAVQESLAAGAIGLKMLGGHYPLTPDATKNVIIACAEAGCYCVFHVGTTQTYSDTEGLEEALDLADGLPIHIAHVNGYCRGYHGTPLDEVTRSTELLANNPNATSDSYVFRWNAVPMDREADRFTSKATRFWLERLGYDADIQGVLRAWEEGAARLVVVSEGRNLLLAHADAGPHPERWLTQALHLSLPANPVAAAVALAAARDPRTAECVVGALATDGGGIPRNEIARTVHALVHLEMWSWRDAVLKTSVKPAASMGIVRSGRLAEGDPADVTVLDEATGEVVGCVVAGEVAYWRGELTNIPAREVDDLAERFHTECTAA